MPVRRRSFRVAGSVLAILVMIGQAAAASAASRPGPGIRDRVVRMAAGRIAAGTDHRKPIKVGSVVIPPCPASPIAWCTTIKVPYDYFSAAAGTIRLGFQWYPATGGKSARTIVAVQGGPGYATTDYASEYV